MQNNCISVKNFEDTRNIYSASKPVGAFTGSKTYGGIDTLFDTLWQRFQHPIETSNERGSTFTHESVALLYYYFQKIDIQRAESYIKSFEWLKNKGATINPKNEKNKCFQYSITLSLNYNKIKNKILRKILKLKRRDKDFSSHQEALENFERNNSSVVLNVLIVSYDSEEIKLSYKSNYNKRNNQVTLLMINDNAGRCYYFAVKDLLELNSSEWLRNEKAEITNNNNCFQNALNDALNYQNIESDPQRISKIKPYISMYNWVGIEFPAVPKDWEKFEKNNKTIVLNILYVPPSTKEISVAYKSKYNCKRKSKVNLLMITNGSKWHYLAVSNLSALLAKKSSNHNGDLYCLGCFNSYTTENRLKEHEEICNK